MQAEALTARGIPAAYLDSSMSSNEYGRVLHAALNKQLQDFCMWRRNAWSTSSLLISPARLILRWWRWTRRTAYRSGDTAFARSIIIFLIFIQALPAKPLVAAFTATATPDVRRDIIKRLGIPEAKIVVTGFDRPNLHFAVQRHAG
mgnify:CR=1 FL=1